MKIVCMNNDFDEYDSYESICAEKVDDNCTFEGLLPYARKGNAYAQYFLSELYKKGVDVIANEERAAFWAKKAKNGFLKCAKEGNTLAQYYTALLYADESKYSEAAEWYLMVSLTDVESYSSEFRKLSYDYKPIVGLCVVESQYKLAQLYKDGNGVKRDVTKSFEWCKKAAEGFVIEGYNDEKQCQFREAWDMLGDFYASGVGTEQNFSAAVEAYEKAGKSEKAKPYYRLAANCIMDKANAIKSDYYGKQEKRALEEKAFSYYKIAAERGDVEALEWLVAFYEKSEKLEDWEKAAEYYEELGDNASMASLCVKIGYSFIDKASRSYYGSEEEEFKKKAIEWYEKAYSLGVAKVEESLVALYKEFNCAEKLEPFFVKKAENGTAEDKWNLGLKYATGEDVAKDSEKAAKWLECAASSGNADWQWELGERYRDGNCLEESEVKACEWFEKVAENSVEKQWKLGKMYADEFGNSEKAELLLEKATAQGDSEMRYELALRYADGDGIGKNAAKAKEWFLKSAESGNKKACVKIAEIYESEKEFKSAAKFYMDAGETEKANRCLLGALDSVEK